MAKTKKIQRQDDIQEMTIEDKLYLVNFKPNIESHIKINPDVCLICKNKECTKFCPANVFVLSPINEEIIVTYENCMECGACRMGCPYEAIKYEHPEVSYGKL